MYVTEILKKFGEVPQRVILSIHSNLEVPDCSELSLQNWSQNLVGNVYSKILKCWLF